jgi:membrane associated rhomboid family serine protease
MSQYYRPQGFNLLPEVTKNLLIINGIFFLASIVLQNRFEIDLNDILGLHYWGAEKFRPYQFVTYMFLHGNFQHILFNMFALWMFGYAVENYWGGKRFLIYYLICGLGAAFTHYAIFFFESREALSAFAKSD